MKKQDLFKKIGIGITAFLLVIAVAFAIYVQDYYHAEEAAMEKIVSFGEVTVTEYDHYFYFDGAGEKTAFIFYPGAKVETESYAPLLQALAQEGVDCFLVKQPLRLAILGVNRADEILDEYDYETMYIGGHSMGGAMAAVYASEHLGDLDGVILLAAYPTSWLDGEEFRALTLVGTEDLVINRKKLEEGRNYMPQTNRYVEITGGNHAQFGFYGEQKGDGIATISAKEQQDIVVSEIVKWILY